MVNLDLATKAADIVAASGAPNFWHADAKVAITKAGLTLNWDESLETARILHVRNVLALIDGLPVSEAIKTAMRSYASTEHRGVIAPRKSDWSKMVSRVMMTTDQWGKKRPEWKPEGTCRLKLKEGWNILSSQESYSDDHTYLIPFEGECADADAAARRLDEFFRRADSHTGMAGSGCNYRVGRVDAAGKFVIVHVRASIGD